MSPDSFGSLMVTGILMKKFTIPESFEAGTHRERGGERERERERGDSDRSVKLDNPCPTWMRMLAKIDSGCDSFCTKRSYKKIEKRGFIFYKCLQWFLIFVFNLVDFPLCFSRTVIFLAKPTYEDKGQKREERMKVGGGGEGRGKCRTLTKTLVS